MLRAAIVVGGYADSPPDARMAEFEAASVDAFARMKVELAVHGAPNAFVARAEEAKRTRPATPSRWQATGHACATG